MLVTNSLLLKLSKRAETYDQKHLVDSFVDVGHLSTLLLNRDNQVLFGRRGTGKTHVLGYLTGAIEAKGIVAVQLDMRSIGSTGGIYSDPRLTLSERATRLLVDTLAAIHDRLITDVLAKPDVFDLSTLAPLLDNFIDAATDVRVEGSVEVEQMQSSFQARSSSIGVSIDAKPGSLGVGLVAGDSSKSKTTQDERRKEVGTQRLRVQFGSVERQFERVVEALPQKELWLILDEWSEVPLDLQPYLADLLRRTVLPVHGIVLKIAAIEQRCQFRIPDEGVGHIGIEIGADVAASLNLDEFLVFDNNAEQAKAFFRELLYRHLVSIVSSTNDAKITQGASEFIQSLFTQRNAFEEFVRSSEGVPRDAINIIGIAAQKAVNNPISVPDIRLAARTWYTRAKQQAIATRPLAQDLLTWIIDEVIQHRQARAFLLGAEVNDNLINFLYDARVLHVIRQGVSAKDYPGRRFNVYTLDYGCYVDLINTKSAPKGLLEVEEEEGKVGYVEVPQTDFRSIRRAILDLEPFYAAHGLS